MEHERWGTPVASYVAGLAPDARPLDRGKPRDEDTEGGSQPADKSLINRRLSLHSQPCAAMAFLADGELAEQALNRASPLDREHKRLVVLLFDLAFELPHCLSVSPHNQIVRAARNQNRRPRILQFSSRNFHNRQHAPNVQEP